VDVFEAIHSRRSVRKYRPHGVDRALLEELLHAAVQAPTPPASGTTPWALCVVEGVERIASYGARAKQYAHEHRPEGRSRTWTEDPDFKVFWDAPALVLFCAQAGNPETPFDCCRAAQNFMLAAHARLLGTCWVGAPLPWLRSPGVAEELGLPQGFEPVVAMVVGHPAEQPTGSPRPRPTVIWCDAK
jgi:nitroreductase